MQRPFSSDGMRSVLPTWLAAILLVMLVTTGCARKPKALTVKAEKTVNRELTGAAGRIVIRIESGVVELVPDPDTASLQMDVIHRVSGDDKDTVLSQVGESELGVEELDEEIRINHEPSGRNDLEESVDVTIRFPESMAFDLEVVLDTGDIRVRGITGRIRLQGLQGDMKVQESTGEMNLFTRNGNLEILDARGPLTANTHNGNMTIRGQSGTGVRATCVVGDLDIQLADDGFGPVIADTTTGRISASLGAAFSGTLNLGASRGTILIEDPGDRIVESTEDKGERTLKIGREGSSISSLGTSSGSIALRIRPAATEDR